MNIWKNKIGLKINVSSLLVISLFLFMKPFILWMTGLPCSGKTTIVKDLQKDIPNLAMLDGDELREWFST